MKKIILTFLIFYSLTAFSQKIELISNSFFIDGQEISKKELRSKLQTTDYKAYTDFVAYKQKSVGGWLLLGTGSALIVTDLMVGLTTWNNTYPSALTFVGGAAVIGSIPVLSGRKKKLNDAIEAYNNKVSNNIAKDYQVNIIANNKGIGIQIGI